MTRLIYSKQEIEAERDYAVPHIECGLKLHGGFDTEGNYIVPRSKYRFEAVKNWMDQLESNGTELVAATTELLTEPNFPNVEQQIFLVKNGIEQPLWDSLTIAGLIEGRGRLLAEFEAPDFQPIIVEDISGTALAHMNKGLLTSHGWDEGGRLETGLGGHEVMWFAVRDLIFGKDKYPIPTAPTSIARESTDREMAQLPPEHEMIVSLLMNVLMVEVRAERVFSFYEDVIGDESLFVDRRAEAKHAIKLVNRIRIDEAVHVDWLRTAVTEFRSSTIKTVTGEQVSGASIMDPVWEKMIRWHAVDVHTANLENNVQALDEKILAAPNGADIIDEFKQLAA
ncbi:MAG: hypothetical protein KUG79_13215 [Pseudomonadales bacterium]|nr:hypothetical protein [Pseudomonadales bacterium]